MLENNNTSAQAIHYISVYQTSFERIFFLKSPVQHFNKYLGP